MTFPACIICDGPCHLDERDRPHCNACAPMLADHVVSMRTDFGKTDDWMAVCPCGWSVQFPRTAEGRLASEAAVIAHWKAMREAGN